MKQARGLPILVLMALILISVDCSAGEWGLGAGVAAQRPPQEGTDTQVVFWPFPSYEGERLSLGFGYGSYVLSSSERVRVAVEGQVRFPGYDPDSSAALDGLKRQDLTLDLGFSLTVSDEWGIATFKLMADTLGVHEGYEISAFYQFPIQLHRLTVVPAIGLKLPSDDLVEYYYGVEPTETAAGRPAYSGNSTLNATVRLDLMYELSSDWEIIGGAEYTRLGDGITDSPIIARSNEVIMYTAIVYHF
jgi:outer membrane protein